MHAAGRLYSSYTRTAVCACDISVLSCEQLVTEQAGGQLKSLRVCTWCHRFRCPGCSRMCGANQQHGKCPADQPRHSRRNRWLCSGRQYAGCGCAHQLHCHKVRLCTAYLPLVHYRSTLAACNRNHSKRDAPAAGSCCMSTHPSHSPFCFLGGPATNPM